MELARVNAAGTLVNLMFLLFCFLHVSDTSIAEKLHPEAIRKGKRFSYQENQLIFSSTASSTQRDTNTGNVPIVNPTPPGTTPIVNLPPPVNPTTTGPPPAPPTNTGPIMMPPSDTGPITLPPTNPGPITTSPTPAGPTTTPPTSSGGSWCIASPTASEKALQVALDYACGYGGSDCSAIQPGGSCYEPNTVRDHASHAFNSYYQKNPGPTSCDFGGAAHLTNTDPSHGNCRFASSATTPTTPTSPTTPITLPPPTTPTPPSITSPMNPYTPGGGTGSGIEPAGNDNSSMPIGNPSSAKTTSDSLLLVITINSLLLSSALSVYYS